ncbi:hypothetical protein JK358_07430 [Nocardia sp. 2]|uniref:Uncharacterized protein n=1 Tax=Nocardia acididurans TaxID=2802282 RepID=A0ABS1M116_9NOCA|nr:hypothetical protein [Nocardia acididurans]MBL1074225.1 hypothetical protein [Nocardia acididurans]
MWSISYWNWAKPSEVEVDLDIRVTSADALGRLTAMLPQADWWAHRPDQEPYAPVPSSDNGDDPYESLPIHLRHWCVEPESVEAALEAAGGEMVAARWDFSSWPPVPELGLGNTCRCAFITVSFNARSIDPDVPSADHTLYIHTEQFHPERATWLASQVGLKILGEPQMSAL